MTTDRGTQIRQDREALGLTRQTLAQRAQMSPGRLAAIETHHGAPCLDGEWMLLRTVLDRGKSGYTPPTHNPAVVRTTDQVEWCGLMVGDPCRVLGQVGARFSFMRYVEQVNGHTYVEVIGGKGRGNNAVHNIRCFTPDRILDRKGRRVQELWQATDPDKVPVAETPTTVDVKEDDDDLADSLSS